MKKDYNKIPHIFQHRCNYCGKFHKLISEEQICKMNHRHILKQPNILDASELKCDCGLKFEWNIWKRQYDEII